MRDDAAHDAHAHPPSCSPVHLPRQVERFAFYEQAKRAFVVVATGETALYGNLILKKGVIGTGNSK